MRISDWSSDVCSSDLLERAVLGVDLFEFALDRVVGERKARRQRRVALDRGVVVRRVERIASRSEQCRGLQSLFALRDLLRVQRITRDLVRNGTAGCQRSEELREGKE